ncbi:MAG: LamG-like jellyroll fold domain-containing protein [Candidatus Sumerlaeia bacterium]
MYYRWMIQKAVMLLVGLVLVMVAMPANAEIVARYTFDNEDNIGEDTAGSIVDHSLSTTGTITTSSLVPDGMSSGSFSADFGTDQQNLMYFPVTDPNDPIHSTDFTVSLWAKFNPPNTTLANQQTVYLLSWDWGKVGEDILNYPWTMIWLRSNVNYYHRFASSIGNAIGLASDPDDDIFDIKEWHHVVLTCWYDSSRNRTFARTYVNGRCVGIRREAAGDVLSTQTLTDLIQLGARTIDETGTRFMGYMDDVQIYNNTMTPDDVEWLYQNPGQVWNSSVDTRPDSEGLELLARYEFENTANVGEDTAGSTQTHHMDMAGTVTLSTETFPYFPAGSHSAFFGNDKQNDLFTTLSATSDLRRRDFTLALWTKAYNLQYQNYMNLVAWDDGPSTGNMRFQDPWRLHWRIGLGESPMIRGVVALFHLNDPKTPYDYTEWRHIVYVVEYDDTWDVTRSKIYIDGQLAHSVPEVATTYVMSRIASDKLRIGSNRDSGYNFRGWMDDIQFYSGPLNSSQVGFLFQNPGKTVFEIPTVPTKNLIARFEFDDAADIGKDTGVDPIDHTMTVHGTISQSDSITTGMPAGGKSADFGTLQTSWMDMTPEFTDTIRTRNFTVLLWAKPELSENSSRVLIAWDDENKAIPWAFHLRPNPAGGSTHRSLSFISDVNKHSNSFTAPDYRADLSDWTHLALSVSFDTMSNETTSRIFYNGQMHSELTTNYAMDVFMPDDKLRLGSAADSVAQSRYTGLMDDVQIYNYNLHPMEVDWLHENPGKTLYDVTPSSVDMNWTLYE